MLTFSKINANIEAKRGNLSNVVVEIFRAKQGN